MDRENHVEANNVLLERLRTLYWDGVQREVCNMILSYQELCHSTQASMYQKISKTELESQGFQRIVRNWTRLPKPESEALYTQTIIQSERDLNVSFEESLSRSLLQSSGFLDIDILYEPANQLFPSYKLGYPNIESIKVKHGRSVKYAWRGMFCYECACLIRSFFFIECSHACPKPVRYPVDLFIDGELVTHEKPDINLNIPDVPYRLCASCASRGAGNTGCDTTHLCRKSCVDPVDKDLRAFRKQLSILEDKRHKQKDPKQKSLFERVLRAGYEDDPSSSIADRILSVLPESYNLITTSFKEFERVVAPAGSFHVALMFGPLIIESGAKNTKRGILISQRPLPKICFNDRAVECLVDDAICEGFHTRPQKCINIFKRKTGTTRYLREQERTINHRHILGSVKRVLGGAFSAFPAAESEQNLEIVREFVRIAQACTLSRSKSSVARHTQLHRSASEMVKLIRNLLEPLVEAHLSRLKTIMLDKDTSLSWNVATNNCQRLVNKLVQGKDFEYFFARLSRNSVGNPRCVNNWPRYLLSFGDCLDGVHCRGQQIRSLVSVFCRRKRSQSDLVEYIERLLARRSTQDGTENSNELWGPAYWHDLLLGSIETDTASYFSGTPRHSREILWSLPRDTFSILQSHLLRPASQYHTFAGKVLSKAEWILNRLRLFRQLDITTSLVSNLGSIVLTAMMQDPTLPGMVVFPKSRVLGGIRADETLKIVQPTAWSTTYFIINRRLQEERWLADAEDTTWFERLSARITEDWPHAGTALKISKRAFKVARNPLGAIINPFLAELSVPFPTVGAVPADAYVKVLADLLKQQLHGGDKWIAIELGNRMTIVHQQFAKNKNFRDSR